ncbi:MAG: UPF0175 family protein [Phormidesmis sp.]
MNVVLTPELENYVRMQIESGRYSSPEEVVGASVRLLETLSDNRLEVRPLYEAYLIEQYRQGEISCGKLGKLLGMSSRWDAEAFLQERGVDLPYSMDDLAQDTATLQRLRDEGKIKQL